ncbi:hypothetical protein [Brumimicrobium aurantiacum]|uniref:Uncharacterized protein n=1 Tax=Brumimicrobium aurantiacum TaxID=1737063 RepID=A0A3E1EV06_9FLAO|nr:hypothetical protein [Brumimicrobium aurantiacum]RFC53399.1 hypothetical protein DXU93_13275 [Brumimicrobium aurantiacum]
MKKLNLFINRLANWKGISILLSIYLLFFIFVISEISQKLVNSMGEPMKGIDLTFGYNPALPLKMVSQYSESSRELYFIFTLTADILYPIIYALFLSSIFTLIAKEKEFTFWKKLPFIILIFDFLENFSIAVLLKSYPNQPIFFAHLCEIFKFMKWTLLLPFALIIVWYLTRSILNKIGS